jgi:hypothetical protein
MFNLALSLEAMSSYSEADATYRALETRFERVRGARPMVLKARARRVRLSENLKADEGHGEDAQSNVSKAGVAFSLYNSGEDET